MSAQEPVVQVSGVSRSFGTKPALSDLTFEVPPGTVTVVLGPNGAGKTTALRVITGALPPSSGTVRVFGVEPREHGQEVRRRCGVVSAQPAVYVRLSGRDNLRYAAALYGLGDGAPIDECAARFGIDHALDDKVAGYSTGMKTRLALARAILHDPDLLLLDEPTSGLDPESGRAVLALIDQAAASGKTVLMCTHFLAEAQELADRVVVLDEGRCLAQGAPSELLRRYRPYPIVLLDAEDRAQLERVAELEGVIELSGNGGPVSVAIDDVRRVPEIVAGLTERGVRLTKVIPSEATLEELYFLLRRSLHGAPR